MEEYLFERVPANCTLSVKQPKLAKYVEREEGSLGKAVSSELNEL